MSFSRGSSGIAVAVSSRHDVYGLDATQPASRQEVLLTQTQWDRKDQGLCIFIDSSYSLIKIVGKEGNFSVTQNMELHLESNLFE